MIDWSLFLSTFALIFTAELPDKTAFAIVFMAVHKHPIAVFIGVGLAFVIQSLIAVFFGKAISTLVPEEVMKGIIGGVFIAFAVFMWIKRNADEESDKSVLRGASFARTIWSSFLVIFIAEWGDLTQLATAAIAAKNGEILTVFVASTLALWSVSALAIVVGNQAKNRLHPVVLKKIAAVSFFLVGLFFLVTTFTTPSSWFR